MSEYFFGLGPGHLPKAADKIARKHGAWLNNYIDAQCKCGQNCPPYTCKAARRHWFSCFNRGSPFDEQTKREVMAELSMKGYTALR